MTLIFQGKVEIIEEHNHFVRSVSQIFKLPSVLRLVKFVRSRRQHHIRFSRENIYLRDDYTCQYCKRKFTTRQLTLDHVIPAAYGGKKTWTNIVAACITCNQKKGGHTPHEAGMALLKKPVIPQWLPKVEEKLSNSNSTPDSWKIYLFAATG